MYKSLEEIVKTERESGKPFWKIVQEDDCRERGVEAGQAFKEMRKTVAANRRKKAQGGK